MLLRSLWLLISAGTILLLAASIAPRHQMLRADVYGLSEGLAGMGLSLDFFATYFVALELLVAAGALLVSALIAWKRGDDWFAMLVATMLAIFGLLPPLVEGLVYVSPGWALPVGMLRMLVMSGAMAALCLFPNGRFAPPWTRWLLLLWLLFALLVTLFDPLAVADTAVLPNTRTVEDARWLLVGAAWFLAAIAGQVIRYRRHASPAEKQQMKWVLFGFSLTVIFSLAIALLLIGFPGLTSSPVSEAGMTVLVGGIYLLTALVLPVAIALSILRYRLWGVDILLNRTLVYGGLSVAIIIIHILFVGGVGTLAVGEQSNLAAFAVATMIVLVSMRPLHRWLQNQADRIIKPGAAAPPPNQISGPVEPDGHPAQEKEFQQSISVRLSLNHTAVLIIPWVVVAVAILAIFSIDLRLSYDMIAAPCEGQQCHYQALTTAEAQALADMGLSVRHYAIYMLGSTVLTVAVFVAIAIWMLLRLYPQRVGLLFSIFLIIMPATAIASFDVVAAAYPSWAAPIQLLFVLGQVVTISFFLVFPNGRLTPRWIFLIPVLIAMVSVFPSSHDATTETASFLLFLAFLLALIAAVVYRYRHFFNHTERQQTKWVLLGMLIFLLGVPIWIITFEWSSPAPGQARLITTLGGWTLAQMMMLALPITIVIAILYSRLWNVDAVINRTLVYGGLTLSITVVYVLLVGGLGALTVTRSGTILGLILATALVLAFLRSPLRARWQTAVDRLVPVPDPISEIPNPISATSRLVQSSRLNQSRSYRWLNWLSVALAIVLTAANMGVAVVSADQAIDLAILTAPAFVAVGTLIIMRQPRNRIGRLCLLVGWVSILVFLGLNRGFVILMTQTDVQFAAITQISLSLAQLMVILIFVYLLLLFPDGQFSGPGWRRFWHIFAGMMALIILLILVKPGPIYDWAWGEVALPNPLGVDWPLHDRVPTEALVYAWGVPAMLAIFVAITSLIMRWRRIPAQADVVSAQAGTRQQVKWVVFFLSTFVALFMFLELVLWLFHPQLIQSALYPAYDAVYRTLGVVAWVGLPLVIGLAVFKYRLYDIDIIINRTLVYGGLSLAIIAVYIVVVGSLGTLFQAQGNFLFALLATGLIAVLFQPVRGRLQQGVNRLMFGERDDPYKVLSQLGQQLQTASTPEATLQSLVETIATTLKLPYVAIALRAIELAGEEGRLSGAVTGKAVAETAEFPLRYQNEIVGYLVVSPRSPGESFTDREQQLLADIAGQAGAMAYSVRLTADLQRSREKLVLAREEERRRIRRDLHDELGPTLASQTFTLDAVLDTLQTDPQAAAQLLKALKLQNQETVADIRRLVYELRPPALDELGIAGTLQAQASRLNGHDSLGIRIISEPDPLPPLPAAVEVAAYRIALEALTNVARHADANNCNVTLRLEENGRSQLLIEVTDDGIGLSPDIRAGVGLHSMRERAEELGGTFDAHAADNGGTQITAVLPL